MKVKLILPYDGHEAGAVIEVGAGVGELLLGRRAAVSAAAPSTANIASSPTGKAMTGPPNDKAMIGPPNDKSMRGPREIK